MENLVSVQTFHVYLEDSFGSLEYIFPQIPPAEKEIRKKKEKRKWEEKQIS